jgi:hypothetical protein
MVARRELARSLSTPFGGERPSQSMFAQQGTVGVNFCRARYNASSAIEGFREEHGVVLGRCHVYLLAILQVLRIVVLPRLAEGVTCQEKRIY